ncbi:hypothetical protein [Psychromicrobium sp. YIM B11713]|uniref:hypothetical protein n=1 Tax=Psychromicrobium sp. YIM B11713 TaxID=3145233 RepID=UPI00374F1CA6
MKALLRPKNARNLLIVSALTASLGLAGCTISGDPAASDQKSSDQKSSSQPSVAQSSSPQSESASPSASGMPSDFLGPNTDTCTAVKATVLGLMVLPLTAAAGKADDPENKKLLANIEALQSKIPAELKPSLESVKQRVDEMLKGGQQPSDAEWEKELKPITDWGTKNCPN